MFEGDFLGVGPSRPKTTWRRTVEREETREGGRAGMWPRQQHATESTRWTM